MVYDHLATEHGIAYEHRIERAGAHHADCFTCVSKQTAIECAHLLDREIDQVCYNGIDVMKVRGSDHMGLYKCTVIN